MHRAAPRPLDRHHRDDLPTVGILAEDDTHSRRLLHAAGTIGVDARLVTDPLDTRDVDLLTVGSARLSPAVLDQLACSDIPVQPDVDLLRLLTDRPERGRMLLAAGMSVLPAIPAADPAEAHRALRLLGAPSLVSARHAPTGRRLVSDEQAMADAVAELGGEVLVEPVLRFDAVLVVLVARRPAREVRTYPAIRLTPAGIPASLESEARTLASRIAELVGGSGALTVELAVFEGVLVVRDLVAGPHPHADVTAGLAVTSQYENHLRGILDLPLGATEAARAPVATRTWSS